MSLVYFALWVIFCGQITLEIFIAGAVVSLLLDQFMKHILGVCLIGATFWQCLKLFPDAAFLVIVLLIKAAAANIAAMRTIIAPNISIEPCLVKFPTSLKTSAARTAFAYSLTLMPGAVTVSLEGNEILVHAMHRKAAAKLEGCIIERVLARMERIVHA